MSNEYNNAIKRKPISGGFRGWITSAFLRSRKENEGERKHAKTVYYIFLRKWEKKPHAKSINIPVKIQTTMYINVHRSQPVGYPSGANFCVLLLRDWYEWRAPDQQPMAKNENRNKLFSPDFDFTQYIIISMAISSRISANPSYKTAEHALLTSTKHAMRDV